MSIETYGTDERLRVAAAELLTNAVGRHLVLLPVPATRDGIHVTSTEIPLSETLSGVGEGSVVVGYGMPDSYIAEAVARGALALELSKDGEYLADNAYITAVGALGYILTADFRIPRDAVYGIVGYGRIGSRLLRLLLFLGARAVVYTTRPTARLELGECGVETVCISDSPGAAFDFSGVDILINTAPRDMTESFPTGRVPEGMRVIELASGDNFRGISGVEPLPSLPGKMYPVSAGCAYAAAALKFMNRTLQ